MDVRELRPTCLLCRSGRPTLAEEQPMKRRGQSSGRSVRAPVERAMAVLLFADGPILRNDPYTY